MSWNILYIDVATLSLSRRLANESRRLFQRRRMCSCLEKSKDYLSNRRTFEGKQHKKDKGLHSQTDRETDRWTDRLTSHGLPSNCGS